MLGFCMAQMHSACVWRMCMASGMSINGVLLLQEEKAERERLEREKRAKQKQKAKEKVKSEKERLAAERLAEQQAEAAKRAQEEEARRTQEEEIRCVCVVWFLIVLVANVDGDALILHAAYMYCV